MSSASSLRRPLRKAVLPVAGFGTRVLPATKAIPKEMLPVFDRPALQYVVDEALAAGIEHIVMVTGRNKAAIEDYFDRSYELEDSLQKKNKTALLSELEAVLTPAGAIPCVDHVLHIWRMWEPCGGNLDQSLAVPTAYGPTIHDVR